jgi:hypothetical protein
MPYGIPTLDKVRYVIPNSILTIYAHEGGLGPHTEEKAPR